MSSEQTKSKNSESTPLKSGKGDNDIKSRLRKHPAKTKPIYIDEMNNKNKKISKKELEICEDILETIKQDDNSDLFREPAINTFTNSEDKEYYLSEVKHPMDLGTIDDSLKGKNYGANEFYKDMSLCWSNALSFNDKNTKAFQCALYLKDLFIRLCKEKGLFEIINKESDNDKDNNVSTNDNEVDNTSTNVNNKKKGKKNKKDNNDIVHNKTNKKGDNSDKSYSTNNDNDSSFSNDAKGKNLVGRKRKRPKPHPEERGKNNEKNKNSKKNNNNNIPDKPEKEVQPKKKKICTFSDIKKLFPIKYKIIYNLKDIEIIYNRRLSNENKKNNKKKNQEQNNTQNNKNKKFEYKYMNSNSIQLSESDYTNKSFINNNNDMKLYDINCNLKNVNKAENQKKKQNQSEQIQKKQNNNNNKINENENQIKVADEKNGKNLKIKFQLAKYFDNLTDEEIIDVMTYIENIRPQAIKTLEYDTIYINFEAFSEETFEKINEYLSNYV